MSNTVTTSLDNPGQFLPRPEAEDIPTNHIRTLGTKAWRTEKAASVDHMLITDRKPRFAADLLDPANQERIGDTYLVKLGDGLEADVYYYQIRSKESGEWIPRVLKVFKDPIVQTGGPQSEESADYDWTVPALIAASNARWADFIYDEEGIIRLINQRDDHYQMVEGGFGNHFRDFHESFAGVEVINTPERLKTYVQWVSWYIQQQTRAESVRVKGKQEIRRVPKYPYFQPYYNQTGQLVQSPWDLYIAPRINTIQQQIFNEFQNPQNPYRGGLAKFVNRLLEITNGAFADPAFQSPGTADAPNPYFLDLPKKAFPDYYYFGKFPSNFSVGEFKNRMYAVMEYVPTILQNEIERLQNDFAVQIQTVTQLRGRLGGNKFITQEINKIFPVSDLNQIYYLATMLHSLGLALADINLGNFAKKDGKIVFLDPSAISQIGKPQDVATDVFGVDRKGNLIYILNETDRNLLQNGGLTASNERDVYIIRRLHEILAQLLYEEGRGANGSEQEMVDMRQAARLQDERSHEARSRRAQRRRDDAAQTEGGIRAQMRGIWEDAATTLRDRFK